MLIWVLLLKNHHCPTFGCRRCTSPDFTQGLSLTVSFFKGATCAIVRLHLVVQHLRWFELRRAAQSCREGSWQGLEFVFTLDLLPVPTVNQSCQCGATGALCIVTQFKSIKKSEKSSINWLLALLLEHIQWSCYSAQTLLPYARSYKVWIGILPISWAHHML